MKNIEERMNNIRRWKGQLKMMSLIDRMELQISMFKNRPKGQRIYFDFEDLQVLALKYNRVWNQLDEGNRYLNQFASKKARYCL